MTRAEIAELLKEKCAYVRSEAERDPGVSSHKLNEMVMAKFGKGIDAGAVCDILKKIRVEKGHPLPPQSREKGSVQAKRSAQRKLDFEKAFPSSPRAYRAKDRMGDLHKVTSTLPVSNTGRPGGKTACILDCGHCVILPTNVALRDARGRRCSICAKAAEVNKPAEALAKKLTEMDPKVLAAALKLLNGAAS